MIQNIPMNLLNLKFGNLGQNVTSGKFKYFPKIKEREGLKDFTKP